MIKFTAFFVCLSYFPIYTINYVMAYIMLLPLFSFVEKRMIFEFHLHEVSPQFTK